MTNPRLVVDELIAARRLEAVPDDLPSAHSRLERAIEKLDAAKAIVEIDVEIAYVSAYDATRIAITAHMLAAGFRARSTRSGISGTLRIRTAACGRTCRACRPAPATRRSSHRRRVRCSRPAAR